MEIKYTPLWIMWWPSLMVFEFKISSFENSGNKKYNCSGPLTFISQRVGYQSNQKFLYYYQYSKNQVNSSIHAQDTADFRVSCVNILNYLI